MTSKTDGSVLSLEAAEEQVDTESDERQVYLNHGRKLAIASDGVNEVIEIRASSGALELRINMTEDGPVLVLEGARLAVKAADSIELSCKTFAVNASEGIRVASEGQLDVTSKDELNIRSEGADVRVKGEKIFLN